MKFQKQFYAYILKIMIIFEEIFFIFKIGKTFISVYLLELSNWIINYADISAMKHKLKFIQY